ncbi:hypothetical protein BV898_18994 [Hypsibius exemplaris]|uniref:Uncharacterized protein n=1 Tax=Hypsibius exemplaris TaxID=2072580 RepID=A0A9X6NR34_HYPEX|nr:hypothetical protein BV898_18994 [Hypsibius exemplaris]
MSQLQSQLQSQSQSQPQPSHYQKKSYLRPPTLVRHTQERHIFRICIAFNEKKIGFFIQFLAIRNVLAYYNEYHGRVSSLKVQDCAQKILLCGSFVPEANILGICHVSSPNVNPNQIWLTLHTDQPGD